MTKQEQTMPSQKALRYNEGKLDWTLLDFKSLEPLVETMMYGSGKYEPFNWQKPCDDPRQHLQSAMRHLTAIIDGEEYDKESGIRHIGHLMSNAMMFAYHTPMPNKNPLDKTSTLTCDQLGHMVEDHGCLCVRCGQYIMTL